MPVEVNETKYPVVFERVATRQDSGGAGKYRGGSGIDLVASIAVEGRLRNIMIRSKCLPWGAEGGKESAGNVAYLIDPEGKRDAQVGSTQNQPLKPGWKAHLMTGGGGGYGDPLERPIETVRLDVQAGYISADSRRTRLRRRPHRQEFHHRSGRRRKSAAPLLWQEGGLVIRAATDVGGTFTDFAAYDEATQKLTIAKSSTTDNIIDAIVACFDKSSTPPASIDYFTHGNTIAINTVIEEKGAKTGLLTTEGFRDVLEIGRGNILNSFDLMFDSPKALVPRQLRLEVVERMLAGGIVKPPLDAEQAQSAIQELFDNYVEAIAVCLLHSHKRIPSTSTDARRA